MLKVEITSTEFDQRSGTSKKTGQPWEIRTQAAYIHKQGQPYPEKVGLTLQDGQLPYQVGVYTLDLNQCFKVGDFGRLTLDERNFVLKPYVKQQSTAKPAA
ncbi:single-stranded DNA-binding protein [Neptunomonas sp. XY-337]|uniref:single-stranded DNA-binding protein n=1 Tax=Neptunomonas sp. XY-337 TaxID=2561897 RepID=UPI0010AA47F5|nr:single-stranded DNA-binding protein [Neptunomonas sp. XY-337]